MRLQFDSGFSPGPVPVYFERLMPVVETSRPTLVLVHGGGHTGVCYQCTPDGRPGWAHRFVERGFPVVVVDLPGMGRSGHPSPESIDGVSMVEGLASLVSCLDSRVILLTHSMSGPYGWQLLERLPRRLTAVVGVAPGPPGNIQDPVAVLNETDAEIEVSYNGGVVRFDKLVQFAPSQIAEMFTRSARFPSDHLHEYVASLVATPQSAILERFNVGGSQLRIRNPEHVAGVPVLVVTGSEDALHPREQDGSIVSWLNSHGAAAEHLWLEDFSITGNGHMMMLEDNSDAIADLIADWLESAVRQGMRENDHVQSEFASDPRSFSPDGE